MSMKKSVYGLGALLVLLLPALAQTPSHTRQNLESAAKGEAEAAAFYRECAKKARSEGFSEAAKLFRAASVSEAIHGENHLLVLRQLGGLRPVRPAAKPQVRSTRENLAESAADEREESRSMYPSFYRTAREEKVPAAMRTFRFAREAERAHERLFARALDQLGRKPAADYYVCQTCGMTTMKSVPAVCSVCNGTGLNYRKIE